MTSLRHTRLYLQLVEGFEGLADTQLALVVRTKETQQLFVCGAQPQNLIQALKELARAPSQLVSTELCEEGAQCVLTCKSWATKASL